MGILKDLYQKELLPKLKEEFNFKNNFEVPRVEKIVINAGLGRALLDSKILEQAEKGLAKITGQKPVLTKAKKSIAGFKLREGNIIGAKVTLRRDKMYDFLDRLINLALPRIRDFRGLSVSSFDGHGNYSLGIKEHTIFPEISPDEVSIPFGLQVNIFTTAKDDEKAKRLLELLGFPFKIS